MLKLKTQLNFISLNVISEISMSRNFVKFQNLEAMFEPKITLKFMKLSEKAQAPKKGSIRAAGFDLFSAVDVEIGSNDQAMISTDLKVAVPRGTYGRVAPWSGIAVDYNVHVGAGVIDEDYRGPLIVVLFNLGTRPFFVKQGDRIAQLICEKIASPGVDVIELFCLQFSDFVLS